MLNLIGEGLAKGAKKTLQETAEEVGENAAAKVAKNGVKEAGESVLSKIISKTPVATDDIADGKISKLIEKAKNYKTSERFYKMNNPIKGSEIWGDKPASAFQRDSRAVRVNMFPNEAVKGTGMTKQYLLNMLKDAYDQGITSIVPSYGIFTKDGASFMDHLAEQGWLDAAARGGGYKSYSIAPKIQEWEKTTPLEDIFQQAHTLKSKEQSLVDMGKTTKAMPDGGIRRIGSADVAPIDPNTLPPSLKAANEYLDEGNFVKDIEKFAGKPYPTLTNDDFLEYSISLKNPKDKDFYRGLIGDMVNDGSTTYREFAASAARNARLNKLRQGDYKDMDVDAFTRYLANHRSQLSDNVSKSIDKELSDRLGIGRSNTFMRDNQVPFDASGVYVPAETALSIKTDVPEEEAVSTLAHERMHSFQNESKIKRYDKRVTDAYDELSKELDKHLRSRDEIAKTYKTDIDYWLDKNEQQSRMLQSYLENAGFTKTGRKPEWGNEVKPAFDKFYDKLRTLSKAGVALPAVGLALLLGENYNNKKKEG